jgi:hypothetical protein
VIDNLNTHTPGSLYEAFDPTEARWLADKLEIPYTPKHASWLDMAEIELSVLSSQCLDRRIPDKTTLIRELTSWMDDRNGQQSTIDWRFTTPDARIKLTRLYPAILPWRSSGGMHLRAAAGRDTCPSCLLVFAGDRRDFDRAERLRLTQRVTYVVGLEEALGLEPNAKS